MDMATFVVILIAILSVIVLINNAVKALREMTKPVTDLRKEIDKINDRLDRVDEKLEDDYQSMRREKERGKMLLKGVKQLVDHAIDGDNIDEMTKVKKEIEDYLVEHSIV